VDGKFLKKMNFGTLGMVMGVLVVIASVVWVTMLNLGRDDHASNDITWVG
jgi:hypothetical protein